MDKQIKVVSYWLGIACVALTIIFRALAAVGIWPVLVPENGAGISYRTFHDAAELFLLLAIAARLMSHPHTDKS